MKKRLISLGLTLFLLFSATFIWMMLSSSFYLGPYFKNQSKTEAIYQSMMQKVQAENSRFLNSYRLDKITYVAEVRFQGNDLIIWFNENLELLEQRPQSSYNEERAQGFASERGMQNPKITLGYYQNKPVIVLNDSQEEVLLDYDTLEPQLVYKKKVV